MSSTAHLFLRNEVLSAKSMLKTLYIVNKHLFYKREVYYLDLYLVLLLDYLQDYMVVSFPSYRVTELLVTNYLIVKYGL